MSHDKQDHRAGGQAGESRLARAGETDTTRFGMDEGDQTEIESPPPAGTGSGLSTGLQPGGMTPGGGPGATEGSIGTGGAANAHRATGDANENMIDEDVR